MSGSGTPVRGAGERHHGAGAALLGLLLGVLLAACGGGGTPSASDSGTGGASASSGTDVTITDFAFSPATLTVAVGDTVTWTNEDATAHTVTADDGSFDSGALAPGATFSETFDAAGTYAYHCTMHPSMTATVVVK